MKFCDKLPKLRKENNLSQEQLADKLGVSRQAVSKWESGSSYPDMEKILQICNILNCTLEDLMDDGSLGKNTQTSKFNFNNLLNDLLKFITKSYNMICSMKFTEKMKCLFEMCFIGIILFIVGLIVFSIVGNLTYNLLSILPHVIESFLSNLFNTIYLLILIIIGFVIFLHLFKIRYLDYFVTIEDKNVSDKTIEEPIEKIEDKKYVEKKKERIIIRDPKHSTLSFFDGLGKIVIFLIKIFLLFILIPIIFCFVLLVFFNVVSLCHIGYNVIFLFVAIAILGCCLINYSIIQLIYKFIVNKKEDFKKFFILCIVGLILIGIGSGLSFVKGMNFKYIETNTDVKYKVDTKYIDLTDTTLIHGYMDIDNIEYVIDNSLTNLKLEISYIEDLGYNLHHGYSSNDYYYINVDDASVFNFYKMILEDIKNNQIRSYDSSQFVKVKIYLSQSSYDKIISNYNNTFN